MPPIIPPRIAKLPVFEGRPVPYVTAYLEGVPDWSRWNEERLEHCFATDTCPMCGTRLGRHRVVVPLGAASIVSRWSFLPAMHVLCAVWSAEHALWHAGQLLTIETHNVTQPSLMHRHEGREEVNLLLLPQPPQAVSWWHAGAPASRATVEDLLHTYETEAQPRCGSEAEYNELQRLLGQLQAFLPEE